LTERMNWQDGEGDCKIKLSIIYTIVL
jgi:hypothetical protein